MLFMAVIFASVQLLLTRMNAVPFRLLLAFSLGYVMVGMYALAHELVHRRIFPYRWMDVMAGYLLLSPEWMDFAEYRTGHLHHHRFATTDKDPGFVYIPESNRLARGINAVCHYLGLSYLLSHPLSIWFPSPAVSRKDACVWVAKSIAPSAAALLLLGGRNWFWHVLCPYLSFCFFNTPKNAAEHDYLYLGNSYDGNQAAVTRNVGAGRWTKLFWCNCMYHVEHHLYPAVPFHNLPEVSLLLNTPEGSESYLHFCWTRIVRGVQYPFFV